MKYLLLTCLLIFSCDLLPAQIRVLLYYDMEGISGVTRDRETRFGNFDYDNARIWLTEDVNAAILGLVDGGATEIVIAGGHSSGNPEPDIIYDQLETGPFKSPEGLPLYATVHLVQPFDGFEPIVDAIKSDFDAVVCIGMHARAGEPGFLARTYSDDIFFKVNGVELSETGLIAVSAARFEIPVIMVSGDNIHQYEINTLLPDVKYAVVKHSDSYSRTIPIPDWEAHRRIYLAAKMAIENHDSISPIGIAAPYEFEIRFRRRAQARRAEGVEGTERIDNTTFVYSVIAFDEGFRMALDLLERSQGKPWWMFW